MTITQRLLGILLFRPAAYRYVALNASLTTESLQIVLIVSFVNSLVFTWLNGFGWQTASSLFGPIISWGFISWLSAWLANKLFKIKVPVARILRALGYAHLFVLLSVATLFLDSTSILYLFLSFVVAVISIVADVLSVREACEISTNRAIAIVLLPALVLVIILFPIFLFLVAKQYP